MVNKKTLCAHHNGSGGQPSNARVSINRDEFEAIGLGVGDEVEVRVSEDRQKIEIVPAERPTPGLR